MASPTEKEPRVKPTRRGLLGAFTAGLAGLATFRWGRRKRPKEQKPSGRLPWIGHY